jgi:hypothetical protein
LQQKLSYQPCQTHGDFLSRYTLYAIAFDFKETLVNVAQLPPIALLISTATSCPVIDGVGV